MTHSAVNERATVRLASIVFGSDPIPLDDPAENYHEASKYYRSFAARLVEGGRRLEISPPLQASSRRSVLRHHGAVRVSLPSPQLPDMSLSAALVQRESCRSFAQEPIGIAQLSTLLCGAYGVRLERDGIKYRTVPSAGALYPLELYVVVAAVDGLQPAVYHFDPHANCLELMSDGGHQSDLEEGLITSELSNEAAVTVIISSVFWRSRFKYGPRGYRCALLEAGHVMQNLLLSAAALGLGAVPLDGFYDSKIDSLIGADGVEHAALYLACIGVRNPTADDAAH